MYTGDMKVVKSNLRVLTAQKSQREGRRISLRTVSEETGISRYAIYALDKNELNHFPKDVLETLCDYFECDKLDDLLQLREGATA